MDHIEFIDTFWTPAFTKRVADFIVESQEWGRFIKNPGTQVDQKAIIRSLLTAYQKQVSLRMRQPGAAGYGEGVKKLNRLRNRSKE